MASVKNIKLKSQNFLLWIPATSVLKINHRQILREKCHPPRLEPHLSVQTVFVDEDAHHEKGCLASVGQKGIQTLKHKRLYSIWVTTLQNISDKIPQKVWDTIHVKWMRWIHKTCRKQMRWREKFFWWKICENELGDNIPHTLCIPQPQPFYNFFPSHLS